MGVPGDQPWGAGRDFRSGKMHGAYHMAVLPRGPPAGVNQHELSRRQRVGDIHDVDLEPQFATEVSHRVRARRPHRHRYATFTNWARRPPGLTTKLRLRSSSKMLLSTPEA